MFVWIKRGFLSVAVLGLLAAAPVATEAGKGNGNSSGPASGAVHLRPTGPVMDRYIVVFEDDVSDVRGLANAMARRNGLTLRHTYTSALRGFAAGMPAPVAEALARDPSVAYVEQDLYAHAVDVVTGVARIGADANVYADIDKIDSLRVDVDVAVIDTGIHPHGDLNVYRFYDCTGGCSGNGDALNAFDDNGHGTHVSGSIGSLDDGANVGSTQVVGVAPGARLWGLKVLDLNGSGSFADVIAGIDRVTAHADEIEVANMSLSGVGFLQSLRDAVQASVGAGVVYVVAASNSAADVYGKDGQLDTAASCKGPFCRNADDYIPSAYPEAMTVSAMGDFDGVSGGATSQTLAFTTCTHTGDDVMACFSNYSQSVTAGNPVTSPGAAIDVAGPGMDILSTYPGGYAWSNGTSMAAPHVAGAVALHIAEYGRANNASEVYAIRQALINNAEPQTDWGPADTKDPDSNHEGLVYVGLAAEVLPANDAPVVTITSPANFDSGSLVTVTGTATDLEDVDLSGYLNWTVDGVQAGSGASYSWNPADGDYLIEASVDDNGVEGGKNVKSGSDAMTITVGTPPVGATDVEVVGITFGRTGGRNGDKHLLVDVTIEDDLGFPVEGVSVSVTVSGPKGGSGTGTTDGNGTATFSLKNAPSCASEDYTATVTDVTAAGLNFDPSDLANTAAGCP